MAAQAPRCYLFNESFRELGATLQLALQMMFNKDKHAFYCHDYACARYLALHMDKVDEFDRIVMLGNQSCGAHFIADIIAIAHASITYATVHIEESKEEAIQKIRYIATQPRFQPKDITLRTIRDNFKCDQDDIDVLNNTLQNAVPYSGSLLTLGHTQDGQTALIVNVFSIQ